MTDRACCAAVAMYAAPKAGDNTPDSTAQVFGLHHEDTGRR